MLALQKKYINNVYKPLVKTEEDTKREDTNHQHQDKTEGHHCRPWDIQ